MDTIPPGVGREGAAVPSDPRQDTGARTRSQFDSARGPACADAGSGLLAWPALQVPPQLGHFLEDPVQFPVEVGPRLGRRLGVEQSPFEVAQSLLRGAQLPLDLVPLDGIAPLGLAPAFFERLERGALLDELSA